ncbi:hypothetical protein OIV83_004060 [Microbotryomycetes sp. JL201]|nr:hypothetical protein OIV83_004060 [Microbotryomycetes sp. JL201]
MAPNAPLYLFQLPGELLDDLRVRELHIPESHPLHESNRVPTRQEQQPAHPTHEHLAATSGQYTCAVTGASFSDLYSLRQHYKTDWYKYNVKLKLQGKPTPVSEQQFESLVEGKALMSLLAHGSLSASISGSDTVSSDDDAGSDASSSSSTNAVTRLLRKEKIQTADTLQDQDEQEQALAALQGGPRSAIVWFESPLVNPGTQFGIYKAALPNFGSHKRPEISAALPEIKQIQLGVDPAKDKERKWTLLMFASGHFAGMVVSLEPKLVSKGKGKEKEREVVVLAKKTFHRYTTRRKQGGAQSANDAGKGKAKSAGAQIRRYNEAMLADEVHEILDEWRELIDESELVFLRCSKSNYRTFFDYDGATLRRDDPRIRGFSFPTRRPTVNELVRAFTELTRVKTSHLSAEALAQLDADYLTSITPAAKPVPTAPKPTPKAISAVPKLTKEEELERDRWNRMVDMVKRGKIEALSSFLDKYGPELEQPSSERAVWGTLPSWMDEAKSTPTLLHVASAADQADMVKWLLVEKRADPTLRLPSTVSLDGQDDEAAKTVFKGQQTPYELAPSRATRNAFRMLLSEHPDWWNWTGTGVGGARVPSGLDQEKEAERDQKTRDRRAMLREKLKERDRERAEKDKVEQERLEVERVERETREREQLARTGGSKLSNGKPARLGGGPPMAMVNREQAGLTEAQRARIEREQRARAAEARLARMGG